MPYEIKTVEDFESYTRFDGVTVIHFWAKWNAYDQIVSKILNEMENHFGQKVKFCTLDVDQENFKNFLGNFAIINVPTLAYFKDGDKIVAEIGLREKKYLQNKINFLLNP